MKSIMSSTLTLTLMISPKRKRCARRDMGKRGAGAGEYRANLERSIHTFSSSSNDDSMMEVWFLESVVDGREEKTKDKKRNGRMISSHLSRAKYDLLFVGRATGPGATLVIGEDGAESQWRSGLIHIRIGGIVACGSQAEKLLGAGGA